MNDTTLDHNDRADLAKRILGSIEVGTENRDHLLAEAQVNATLAVAEEIALLREALTTNKWPDR